MPGSDGHILSPGLTPFLNRRHKPPHARRAGGCEPAEPANTVTDRLNSLLQNGGPGYILSLCQNQRYQIQKPIAFAHPNQEISTVGYPEDDNRAILVVSGPEAEHSVAVDGVCNDCDGVRLRNVQIDGSRQPGASSTGGGGNIEMGGDNSNQLIEHVRTFNPRSWTCLHIAEGHLSCNNATIQHNDIGPCGIDTFQQWADGISLACRNSVVKENLIVGATDGGIVVFGSPGSIIEDNTIWVLNQTLLGGINLVDVNPFGGDYKGTVVRNNEIYGGFATDEKEKGDTAGNNFESAIIKIGIAVGPRTWFGDKFGDSRVEGAIVTGNKFSGALSYAIAVTSANNFTILDNTLNDDVAFIGSRGPNCTSADSVPSPAPWIVDWATVGVDMNAGSGKMQSDFVGISDGDSLTCVLPPSGGDFWPFGHNPSNSSSDGGLFPDEEGGGGGPNKGGIAAGVIFALIAAAAIAFFGRKWYLKKSEETRLYKESKRFAHS